MDAGPGANLDLAPEIFAQFDQGCIAISQQLLGDMRVYADRDAAAAKARQIVANFAQHLEGDARAGQNESSTLAIVAWLAQGLKEILTGSLAGHLDQAEFGDLQDIGAGLVGPQGVLQGSVDLLAVSCGFHVDQVDDDQATDVAETQLVDNLANGLEVGPQDRVFEVALAGETPRIDVDRGQGLSLVEHQMATGFEHYLALEVVVDLRLE